MHLKLRAAFKDGCEGEWSNTTEYVFCMRSSSVRHTFCRGPVEDLLTAYSVDGHVFNLLVGPVRGVYTLLQVLFYFIFCFDYCSSYTKEKCWALLIGKSKAPAVEEPLISEAANVRYDTFRMV